ASARTGARTRQRPRTGARRRRGAGAEGRQARPLRRDPRGLPGDRRNDEAGAAEAVRRARHPGRARLTGDRDARWSARVGPGLAGGGLAYQPRRAIASISTFTLRGRPAACTVERAGL